MDEDNFIYHVIIYLMVGIGIVDIFILIRDIIYGSIEGFPHPWLSWIFPFGVILVLYPIRKRLNNTPMEINVLVVFWIGILYMGINQTFFLCYSAIFSGFSAAIIAISCAIVYADRFNYIKRELDIFKVSITHDTQSDFVLEYIRMLHKDIQFFLDKAISGIYWAIAVLIAVFSILWGLAGEVSTQDFSSFPVWSFGFLIIFLYIGMGVSFWVLKPLHIYLNDLRSSTYELIHLKN